MQNNKITTLQKTQSKFSKYNSKYKNYRVSHYDCDILSEIAAKYNTTMTQALSIALNDYKNKILNGDVK